MQKPLLFGCAHLLPLPGSPLYNGDLEAIYNRAIADADNIIEGGFDGLIIENFGDIPFFPNRVPPETVAVMSAVARSVKSHFKKNIPIGINVLRNDGEAAAAIATAIGANFIRINVFVGAVIADQGLIVGECHAIMRKIALINPRLKVFADVGVKHAAPLAPRGIAQEADDAVVRGLANGIILSGNITGAAPNLDDVNAVKRISSVPIMCGSGATLKNILKLAEYFDGFIIGSDIKEGGEIRNPVSIERVHAISKRVEGDSKLNPLVKLFRK